MFQKSQNDEYLELCVNRVKNKYLTWVEQFLDIISENVDFNKKLKLNDIGCNLGQFWKGLKNRGMNKIDYNGFDFEEVYLKKAINIFPELSDKLDLLDITNTPPPSCDITVCSATLEHLQFLQPGLDNMLLSTDKLILLRSFLGESQLKSIHIKKGAMAHYDIHQFSFHEVFSSFKRHGFSSIIIRDRYTDSMPRYLDDGIIRTFYVVMGVRI